VTIWLVVWYLASRLSGLIRERDRELTETNERLAQVQAERAKHMLRTTHELKAPFAAIHANADLLLKGYCGDVPREARAVVERIATRCQRLAVEIQEMLNLAMLRSASETPLNRTQVRLDTVLKWCMAQVQVTARQRNVTLVAELAPIAITAVEGHLRLLFSNLLSNAVSYSHVGGRVEVACQRGENQDPIVRIKDHGIGIPEDKLPLIFDEYYRTDEAVRHNKNSTGLGLAIVRHVAELHGIEITVRSTLGVNTTFELCFPQH
jgi:signal transduction histidine kinase